jgi:predicted transcriptional regulator
MISTITQPNMDIRDKITDYLKDVAERDLGWLAKKTDIPYGTLYSIFKQKTVKLSEEKKAKINEVLGTQF